MKNTILALAIALAVNCMAQTPTPSTMFIYGAIDPSMYTKGAYPNRAVDEKAKGLDYKLGLGWEFPNTRVRAEIQSFKEIGFTKFTYLMLDYKMEPIKNIYLFAGAELSHIKRHHPDFHYSKPNNYREYVISRYLLGVNAEIQYRLGSFGFGLQFNAHEAEEELKPYKDYRYQVHGVLTFYFNPARNE